MSETLNFAIKKSIKWIWVAIVFGGLCTAFLYFKSSGYLVDNVYSGGWDKYPQAHRYAIFSSEIKPEYLKAYNNEEGLMNSINSYNELIRQHIMLLPNQMSLYQDFILEYPELFPEYKIDSFLQEMVAVYWNDASTLVICTNAPNTINKSKYSNEELCEMRDYVFEKLIFLVENDDYINTFPVSLIRASKNEEASLSEQEFLKTGFGSKESISGKKMALVFIASFIFAYMLIILAVLANGRVKTAEELMQITNLQVFDELLRKQYDDAIKIIKAKLGLDSEKPINVLADRDFDTVEAERIARDLSEQGKAVCWDEGLETIFALKDQEYIILIKQNKTSKRRLGLLAKELSQINAKCVGAVITR